jgi:hypothetical protein
VSSTTPCSPKQSHGARVGRLAAPMLVQHFQAEVDGDGFVVGQARWGARPVAERPTAAACTPACCASGACMCHSNWLPRGAPPRRSRARARASSTLPKRRYSPIFATRSSSRAAQQRQERTVDALARTVDQAPAPRRAGHRSSPRGGQRQALAARAWGTLAQVGGGSGMGGLRLGEGAAPRRHSQAALANRLARRPAARGQAVRGRAIAAAARTHRAGDLAEAKAAVIRPTRRVAPSGARARISCTPASVMTMKVPPTSSADRAMVQPPATGWAAARPGPSARGGRPDLQAREAAQHAGRDTVETAAVAPNTGQARPNRRGSSTSCAPAPAGRWRAGCSRSRAGRSRRPGPGAVRPAWPAAGGALPSAGRRWQARGTQRPAATAARPARRVHPQRRGDQPAGAPSRQYEAGQRDADADAGVQGAGPGPHGRRASAQAPDAGRDEHPGRPRRPGSAERQPEAGRRQRHRGGEHAVPRQRTSASRGAAQPVREARERAQQVAGVVGRGDPAAGGQVELPGRTISGNRGVNAKRPMPMATASDSSPAGRWPRRKRLLALRWFVMGMPIKPRMPGAHK